MSKIVMEGLRASGVVAGVSAIFLGKSAYYISKGAYNVAKGAYESGSVGEEGGDDDPNLTESTRVPTTAAGGSANDDLDIMYVPQLRKELRKYDYQSLDITSRQIDKATKPFLVENIKKLRG